MLDGGHVRLGGPEEAQYAEAVEGIGNPLGFDLGVAGVVGVVGGARSVGPGGG